MINDSQKKISFRDTLRHFGIRNTITYVISALLAGAVVLGIFSSLYSSVRENIWMRGELNSLESADKFNLYLTQDLDAVKLTANTIDMMINEGKGNDEILAFIKEETEAVKDTINPNFSGFYAVINGEYLDGAGWNPGPGFKAEERPWYIESMKQDSEIAYVRPYLDLQAGTVMMTVTCKLEGRGNLLALDIPMNRMQEITEEIAATTEGSMGMILDNYGNVAVHSDETQLGHNLLEEEGTIGRLVADRLINGKETGFEFGYEGVEYIVYSHPIENGWYSVSVIDSDVLLRPLKIIRMVTVLAVIAIALLILYVFLRIYRKQLMIKDLNSELSTIAEIYESVYDISLKDDTFREISGKGLVSSTVGENRENAQKTMNDTLDILADESSREVIGEFTDFSTLEERLKDEFSITEVFLSRNRRWCRARFIASQKDEEGHLSHVLFLVESIDAEKRRSDELLRLSETDRMTGLYNRVSGENRITSLISEGCDGVFMMIDADKFKSINDTYGHNVGDEVLIAIANAMKSVFRSGDILTRMGGDEFSAYAPGVHSVEVANNIIRRLFSSLKNNRVEAMGDNQVTVSVGVVFSSKDEPISFARLYEKADSCLYDSKKTDGYSVTYHNENGSNSQYDL